MSFVQSIPYIVVAVIWLFMLVLALIIYLCNKGDNLHKVYENCTEETAQYQYIVGIAYQHTFKEYDVKNTTITVDIRNSKLKSLSKIAFTPQIMRNVHKDPKRVQKKVARFRLFRSKPIKDIAYVDLNHNCTTGTIFISDFIIQDVTSDNANVAYPSNPLESLPKHRNEVKQQFPAGKVIKQPISDLLGKSPTLSCLEFIAFLFLSVNVILFSCVFIIPCSSKTFCADYSDGVSSSAFAGLLASVFAMICFVVTIVIYRYSIKRRYAKDIKHCAWIRLVYIYCLILIGMFFGILAAIFASNNKKFKYKNLSQPYEHEIYWTLACGIGIIIFMLIWIPIFALIAYFCGFFGAVSVKEMTRERSPKKGSSGTAGATVRTKDEEEANNNQTAKRKSKSGPKSKSKSAPKSKSRLKVANESKKAKRSESSAQSQPRQPPVQRTESQESTGENYYQTIVQRHGKVKSVSQYPGIGR